MPAAPDEHIGEDEVRGVLGGRQAHGFEAQLDRLRDPSRVVEGRHAVERLEQQRVPLLPLLRCRAGRRAPLAVEESPVARHRDARVDAVADERAAPVVVDEHVARDHVHAPCEPRPQAQVVVLEVAAAERLVERADFGDERVREQDAEAHHAR